MDRLFGIRSLGVSVKIDARKTVLRNAVADTKIRENMKVFSEVVLRIGEVLFIQPDCFFKCPF